MQNKFYSQLTISKLLDDDNDEVLQALYYHEKSGAIYTLIFKDDLSGAADFNRFLARIKKRYADEIRFYNHTGKPFKTPGIEVYFRFDFEYFNQDEQIEELPL